MLDDREFVRALMAPLRLLVTCALGGRMDAAVDCARHILTLIESRNQ